MTAIAHAPDNAVADGVTDDTSALQSMFDAVPVGGRCIIPDGVYRVTGTVQVPKPMHVWCSPGAHIKGDFAAADPVIHTFWHTPDGTSDLYVAMEAMYWQGGTISRRDRNGPCFRGSTWWGGCLENLRTLRGSPHIVLDAPDTAEGWYKGGFGPNFAAISRIVMCRGHDGGPFGCQIGQQPNFTSSGQSNGMMMDSCYFEGDGTAGSLGIDVTNGGGGTFGANVFVNYETGYYNRSNSWMVCGMSNLAIGATDSYTGEGSGSQNRQTLVDPRGWTVGVMEFRARDPQGIYPS